MNLDALPNARGLPNDDQVRESARASRGRVLATASAPESACPPHLPSSRANVVLNFRRATRLTRLGGNSDGSNRDAHKYAHEYAHRAAVEEARAAARDAPPEDEEEDEAIGKALFPARVFDPLFSLGITFDEDTLEVLGVARDGQGFQTGVLVGWRAVYVGETRAPLGSLQQLINELTAARQEQRRLAVVFEGDARE